MNRSIRLLAVAVASLSLLVGIASPATVAVAQGPECDGLDTYVIALESWGAGIGTSMETVMPGTDESNLDAWSSEQFTAASEVMAAAQTTLQEIEAPDIATEYHTTLVAQIGMVSQMFDTMATMGIFGALVYAEQLDVYDQEMKTISAEIEAACGISLDALGAEFGEDAGMATPSAVTIDTNDDDTGVPSSGAGTRAYPIPIGQTVAIGNDWELTVLSVTPNATDLVLAESSYNEPPAAGHQFFLANVRITYTGDDSDSFYGWGLRAVGQSAVAYSQYDDNCGSIPDELPSRELFTGGTIEGNICWSIEAADADSLVLYDSDQRSGERVFFSLMLNGLESTPVASPEMKGR